MKRIITHIRPHLDENCAIWLIKRYLPGAKDAVLEFIPTNQEVPSPDADPETVYVGVGRGRFDEHKGDINDCATTLVWSDLKSRIQLSPAEVRAIEKMVAWVFQEDTGRLGRMEYRSFAVPVILSNRIEINGGDSADQVSLGSQMLDAIMRGLLEGVALEDAWDLRQEFASPFGRAVALTTEARKPDYYGYARGFDLVVWVKPDLTYQSIRVTPDKQIDLTPVYKKLLVADPEADWYFHHSHRMLICGSDLQRGDRPSRLTLTELIALLK